MARKQSAHALLPMTKGRPADAERPPAVPFVGEGESGNQIWRWAILLRSLRAPSMAWPKQVR